MRRIGMKLSEDKIKFSNWKFEPVNINKPRGSQKLNMYLQSQSVDPTKRRKGTLQVNEPGNL